jgi:hypothetical protein
MSGLKHSFNGDWHFVKNFNCTFKPEIPRLADHLLAGSHYTITCRAGQPVTIDGDFYVTPLGMWIIRGWLLQVPALPLPQERKGA